MQRILLGLALCMAGTPAALAQQQASEVYQWRDAAGVTHYSQTPPAKGAYQTRRIHNDGGAGVGATASASAEAPAAAPAPATTGSGAERATAECTRARENIAALEGSTPVQQDTDGDGKPDTTLDDSQRAGQLNLARAAVQAYCTP